MFDTRIGRWMEEDPIGFAAGDANLYRYVGNDPTNNTDPSGLADRPITIAIDAKYKELWEKANAPSEIHIKLTTAKDTGDWTAAQITMLTDVIGQLYVNSLQLEPLKKDDPLVVKWFQD